MKKLMIFIPLVLTTCQSNYSVIQQASRNLAEQSRQVTPPPPTSTFPWLPILLIVIFVLLAVGAITGVILLYRSALQAAQSQQDATIQAQKAQLRAERRMLQRMLPPQTPPPGPPQPPYQTPQEPPRRW
jgi:ABC-type protease/lipase transport system fused ATPase/permease subunit